MLMEAKIFMKFDWWLEDGEQRAGIGIRLGCFSTIEFPFYHSQL
jgi:hypothetical protein